MPDHIVIRLHPIEPMTGGEFENLLANLVITAYDKSFNELDGVEIGQAQYAPLSINNTIVQHDDGGSPAVLYPVATAVIAITEPAEWTEYVTSDVILRMTRNGNDIAPLTTHYNIQVHTAAGMPAQSSFPSLEPTSAYLTLPGLGVILDPNLPDVEIPTDGSPPKFDALRAAVIAVLNQDPVTNWDLAALTLPECLHIANELVWNRQFEPLPEPPRSLETLYSPSNDLLLNTERARFEAQVQGYYAQRQAEAEQLSRYIYSMSAAIQCQNLSAAAAQVSLRYPIQPGVTDTTGRIAEADVTLEN